MATVRVECKPSTDFCIVKHSDPDRRASLVLLEEDKSIIHSLTRRSELIGVAMKCIFL